MPSQSCGTSLQPRFAHADRSPCAHPGGTGTGWLRALQFRSGQGSAPLPCPAATLRPQPWPQRAELQLLTPGHQGIPSHLPQEMRNMKMYTSFLAGMGIILKLEQHSRAKTDHVMYYSQQPCEMLLSHSPAMNNFV